MRNITYIECFQKGYGDGIFFNHTYSVCERRKYGNNHENNLHNSKMSELNINEKRRKVNRKCNQQHRNHVIPGSLHII
jgi:hypothetical protein